LVTVFARELVPRVRSKEKGDLLMGCERGAGKGIVGKEVGEGRGYGVALGGVVGAGKDHMEFVTEGVGGAVRAEGCGENGRGAGAVACRVCTRASWWISTRLARCSL
jgi:hypothetical protein